MEKHLEKRAGELFKVSGKNPELNQVLRQLEEVRARLDALKDRPEKYLEERERLASLGRQQEEAVARQEHLARELGRLSRLEAALGDLGELGRLRTELAALPDLAAFPPGGETRLEELLQRCKEARAQQARVEELLSTGGAELARLSAASAVRGAGGGAALGAGGLHREGGAAAGVAGTPCGARGEAPARWSRRSGDWGWRWTVRACWRWSWGRRREALLESLADRLAKAEAERREAEVALGQGAGGAGAASRPRWRGCRRSARSCRTCRRRSCASGRRR